MARIYTSRQLLDPRMIQMANQATENRIAQEAARRQNVLNAWQNVATTAGGTYDQYRARADREEKLREGIEALRPKPKVRLKYADSPMYQMVMENNPRHMGKNSYFTNQREIDEFDKQINDPAFIAAADEFIRTGTSSPLGNLVLQRQAAAARDAAAAEAKAERKEKEDRLEKLRLADVQNKIDDFTAKGVSAAESGKYDTAELYMNQAKNLADANGLTFDKTGYIENAKKTAAAKAASRRKRSELENYLLAGFETDADIQDFKQRVSNARDDGLINDEDANGLYQMASSAKSNQSKYREGAVNTGVGIQNEKIKENAEDKKAANKSWQKLQRGEAIIGNDERIFLKIYGNDPEKMNRYREING